MNLSQIGYQYRAVVMLSTIAFMVYGIFSYFNLPAREDPNITIREAVIESSFPGLPAERVEQLMTKPLEEALLTVSSIEEIRSTSIDGRSILYAKAYEHIFELDQVWNEAEEAVITAHAQRLPNGASKPRVNDNFGDVAVITLALTGKDFNLAEIYDFAQHARETLNTIPGTRKVDIVGALQERIFVEASNARLAELGIPPNNITAALRQQNTIVPGGAIDTGDRAFALIPTGDFQSVEDVRNVLVRIPGDGSLIALRDIANVERGFADPAAQRAYFNGMEAVVLSIVMHPSESAINYAKGARPVIDDLKIALPVGLNLDVITWQADQVENAVYGVSLNVIQTLAIVLAVVMLFLGVRTGLIVGSIVPTVMLVTLAIMGMIGMSLERMSLATLVIALGLLVDNGVVTAENFKRLLAEHGDRDRALTETGRELAIPLLSSSLTTILVFLPLMLAQHSSGEYTRNISLVILITLSASWVIAMVVTPALCHRFLKAPERSGSAEDTSGVFKRIEKSYGDLLHRLLRRPILFVICMFALLPLGGFMMTSAPAKFFPNSDRPQVLIYVNLPAGVTTRTTQARMQSMMEIIGDESKYPDLGDYAAYVGFGGPRFVLSLAPIDPAPNVGFIVVNGKDRATIEAAIPRLRNDFRDAFPDVEARVSGMFLGPSDPNVLQVQVKGPDAQYLYQISKQLEAMMSKIHGSIDIWSNWYNPVTRLKVDIDQVRAQRANVSSEDVASTLAHFVEGVTISEFRDADEVFPIVTRAVDSEREQLGRLETISVYSSRANTSVPLGQIANISTEQGFPVIQREDLIRTITIEARNLLTSPEDMAPLLADRIALLNSNLAPGHHIEFDGIVVDSAVGRSALFANFPLCLGLAVLLLVAQFNNYRRPLIVILTVPLVILGVGMGLQIMQAEFGFLVILGLFALAGIIVNNAIVLIDRIDIERNRGNQNDFEAVVVACSRRLRPILITTITTIVGLLPLILTRDVLFFGMATIMAFGMAVGTLLTLGVAPALYCISFGIKAPPKSATRDISEGGVVT